MDTKRFSILGTRAEEIFPYKARISKRKENGIDWCISHLSDDAMLDLFIGRAEDVMIDNTCDWTWLPDLHDEEYSVFFFRDEFIAIEFKLRFG